MTMLHTLLSVLSLTAGAEPAQSGDLIVQDIPRRYVVVERPGEPPVVVKGSDEVLARDDLVGMWQVVYLERRGDSLPELASQLHVRFTRGKLELMQANRAPIVVAYNLNIDNYPRHFTWIDRRCGSLTIQRGIYWLEGETLLLCMAAINKRRPTEFITAPYDGRTMFALERVETEEPSPAATSNEVTP
jgi:uncharacterized protein (TIGR03067 family)